MGSGVSRLLHYTVAKPRPECTCSKATLLSMRLICVLLASHLLVWLLCILHRPRQTIPIYRATSNPYKLVSQTLPYIYHTLLCVRISIWDVRSMYLCKHWAFTYHHRFGRAPVTASHYCRAEACRLSAHAIKRHFCLLLSALSTMLTL